MSLFPSEIEEELDALEQPPELASAKTVRLLEAFGYRREAVRKWTAEKAETVLKSCQREARLIERRAAQTAKAIDGDRGQPSLVERAQAAGFLEQAQGADLDELLSAVMYTVYCLTDDELKRLAGYLIRLYRGAA